MTRAVFVCLYLCDASTSHLPLHLSDTDTMPRISSPGSRFLSATLIISAFAFGLGGCSPKTEVADVQGNTATAARAPYDPNQISQTIALWEGHLEKDPQSVTALNQLAAAYLQRQRETGDISDAVRAESCARRALKLIPQNVGALLKVGRALLAQHKFPEALVMADRALKVDPQAERLRADVLLELGRYSEAGKAISAIPVIDRDPNATALLARWHELHGQSEGALKLWQQSSGDAARNMDLPPESASWFFVKLGNCQAQMGQGEAAEKSYRGALEIFPNDYRAMSALARLFARRHDWKSAAEWAEKSVAVIPEPEIVGLLGDVYAAQGDTKKAKQQYALVETIAQLAKVNGVIYDRQRALYLCDHDKDLPAALTLARGELKLRRDIYTWDTLAWALYKNKQLDEARSAANNALKLGTRDALLWFHAGMIDFASGDKAAAKKKLTTALEINPQFHPTFLEEARQVLKKI